MEPLSLLLLEMEQRVGMQVPLLTLRPTTMYSPLRALVHTITTKKTQGIQCLRTNTILQLI